MFGKLLSEVINVVTLPIDVFESTLDVLTGGDGSKDSKKASDVPRLGDLRDGICQGIRDVLDKE